MVKILERNPDIVRDPAGSRRRTVQSLSISQWSSSWVEDCFFELFLHRRRQEAVPCSRIEVERDDLALLPQKLLDRRPQTEKKLEA
jgi:hypothetical protein